MSLPCTVQTNFSHHILARPPAHPNAHLDAVCENNTPTAPKGCGVKKTLQPQNPNLKSVAMATVVTIYTHPCKKKKKKNPENW